MSEQNKKTLKRFFEQGDRPTQGQYANLIDSALNLTDSDKQGITSDIVVTGSGEFLGSFTGSKAVFADLTFTGSMTASGDISSSGDLIVNNITSSGTISSSIIDAAIISASNGINVGTLSGIITASARSFNVENLVVTSEITTSGLISSSNLFPNTFAGNIQLANGRFFSGLDSSQSNVALLGIDSSDITQLNSSAKSLKISGPITASSTISSSEAIIAKSFTGSFSGTSIGLTGTPDIEINNLTASSDISSSGTVRAAAFVGDGSGLTNITVTDRTETISLVTASLATGSLIISGSDTYTSGSTTRVKGLEISGSILPKSNNTMDIGSPTNAFRTVFVADAIIPIDDGGQDIGSPNKQFATLHASTHSVGEIQPKNLLTHIRVKGHLRPQSTSGGYELGQSGHIWASSHVQIIHVDTLSGSGGGNQSLINLSASLAPGTDNLYILGTANKIFKSIHVATASLEHIEPLDGGDVVLSGSFLPHAHALYDLGKPGTVSTNGPDGFPDSGTDGTARQWKDAYIYGTASVNVLRAEQEPALFFTGSSFAPMLTQQMDLGLEGLQWNVGYFNIIDTNILRNSTQQIVVSSSLIPNADNTYTLGTETKEWKEIYIDGFASIDLLGNNHISTSDVFTDVNDIFINLTSSIVPIHGAYVNNATPWNLGTGSSAFQNVWAHRVNLNTLDASGSSEDIKVVGHLVPHTDDNYDLGEPDKEWRNAYFDGFVSLDKLKNFSTSEFNIDSNVSPAADNEYYFGRTEENGDSLYRWKHMASYTQSVVVLIGTSSKLNAFGRSNAFDTTATNADTIYYGDTSLEASGAKKVIFSDASFMPHTHDTYDLGGTFHGWRNLYLEGLIISGGVQYPIDADGNVLADGDLNFVGNILPDADNTGTVGSTQFQWKEGHFYTSSIAVLDSKQSNERIRTFAHLIPGDTKFELGTSGLPWQKLTAHDVSSSGTLHVNTSLTTATSYKILAKNPDTGEVFHINTPAVGSTGGGGGGGDADNLGNHTATQDLNLDSNNIKGVAHITMSGDISASGDGTHFFGGNIDTTNITASGLISASGDIYGRSYYLLTGSNSPEPVLKYSSETMDGLVRHVEFGFPNSSSNNNNLNTHIYGDNIVLKSDDDIILNSEDGDVVRFQNNSTDTVKFGLTTGDITLVNHITASGDISSSGNLFIETSEEAENDNLKTLVINPTTGKVFHTGSYGSGGGGGGGGGISFDGSTTNGVLTFKDSDEATVESNLTFDGSLMNLTGDLTASGGILTNQTLVQIDTFVSSSGATSQVSPLIVLKDLPIVDQSWTLNENFVPTPGDPAFDELIVGQVFAGPEEGNVSYQDASSRRLCIKLVGN